MINKITKETRLELMIYLGLNYDGKSFTYEDINFHWTDIVCMSDEQFKKAYDGACLRKIEIDKFAEITRLDNLLTAADNKLTELFQLESKEVKVELYELIIKLSKCKIRSLKDGN